MDVTTVNGIQNTTKINVTPKAKKPSTLIERLQDTFEPAQYSETLRCFNPTIFGKTLRYQGNIDRQKTSVDVTKNKFLFDTKSTIKGIVGDKAVDLSVSKEKNVSKYSGTFNGKEINLEFQTNLFKIKKDTIKGSIGDETIDIEIPGSKAPTESDTIDILTLIASLNDNKFNVKNGNFKHYSLSQAALEQRMANEMEQQARLNNSMMNNTMQMPGMM